MLDGRVKLPLARQGGENMNLKPSWLLSITSLLLVFGLVISGCNFPGIRPTPNIQATNAAGTVIARLTQPPEPEGGDTPTLPPPPPTTPAPPPVSPTPSNTPLPTLTPSRTPTEIPCDQATFVDDVTIPDGTEIQVGDNFTKTWRLKNTGTCTWTSGYSLVFDHGDSMSGPATKQLTSGTVAPGQTVDISVDLTAPSSDGTYKGYYLLRNSDGVLFGVGSSGDVAFWVEIEAVEPKVAFKLTFANIHQCDIYPHYATVKVENTGDITFESVRVHIFDKDDGDKDLYGPFGYNDNWFLASPNGCPPGADSLEPGDSAYLSANMDANGAPPSGHKIRYFVTLCTEEGGGGDCENEAVNFNAP
jgi:hypothetical protein